MRLLGAPASKQWHRDHQSGAEPRAIAEPSCEALRLGSAHSRTRGSEAITSIVRRRIRHSRTQQGVPTQANERPRCKRCLAKHCLAICR